LQCNDATAIKNLFCELERLVTLSIPTPAHQRANFFLAQALLTVNMVLILTSCASNSGRDKPDAAQATQVSTVETSSDLSVRKTPEPDLSKAQDPRPPTLICHREKVLGSNRSVKVCRTKAQIENERQGAKVIGGRIRNATSVRQRGVE
jgi:hypothetical protein